ncbi:hypothetical protein IK110_04460 [Candidatus Saccharibacteria bacterium]|nr:hypothetical protein [Candidatus Saccharibacteria bacterium]
MDALLDLRKQYEEYKTSCDCGRRIIMSHAKNANQMASMVMGREICRGITCRMKEFDSVVNKAMRKNYPLTMESIKENIKDIAGVRIITLFKDDIYLIRDVLINSSRIKVLEEIDYIKTPKPNGYMSLHLVVEVQISVLLENMAIQTRSVPVEIQIRDMAMELWGEVEHVLCYKNDNTYAEVPSEFKELSNQLSNYDEGFVALRKNEPLPKKTGRKAKS